MRRSVHRRSKKSRRGLTVIETVVLLGVISVAVIIGAALIGGSTATRIQETAVDVGDPHELKHFFDNMANPPP